MTQGWVEKFRVATQDINKGMDGIYIHEKSFEQTTAIAPQEAEQHYESFAPASHLLSHHWTSDNQDKTFRDWLAAYTLVAASVLCEPFLEEINSFGGLNSGVEEAVINLSFIEQFILKDTEGTFVYAQGYEWWHYLNTMPEHEYKELGLAAQQNLNPAVWFLIRIRSGY